MKQLERFRWLWGFWRPYRAVLALIIVLTLVHSAISVTAPWVTKDLIDGLQPGLERRALARQCGLLVAIALGTIASYIALQTLRARMNLTLEWQFRQRAFERLLALSPRFYSRFRTGDLVTRLTDDVAEKLSWFACSGIFRGFEAASRVVAGLVAMLLLSPRLTLIVVLPLPLVVVLFIFTRRALQSRFDRRQQAISAGNDLLESAFSGIRVLKAHGHLAPMERQFGELIARRKSAEVRATQAEVLTGSLYAQTWQVAVVICLVAGGWLVVQGRISMGTLVAMMSYVTLLVFPMFDIGQFFVSTLRSAVSIDRLRELEAEVPEVREPAHPVAPESPRGELAFDGVTVRLGTSTVLDGVSFSVPAGSRVALAGPIGSGKTILTRLVPRLLDPDEGQVLLDGVPLSRLSLGPLRGQVGFVPQDPILFSGTVEENIRAGRDGIAPDRIAWACRVARLERDLGEMPQGLATVVGARGLALSGGQKQRVSLARALVGRPQVLVLDDCTASLDAETEAELWQELAGALPGATCLLITHRTATLEAADRVVVLEAGRLVESGTHRELAAAGGAYARLYRRQRLEETVRHER